MAQYALPRTGASTSLEAPEPAAVDPAVRRAFLKTIARGEAPAGAYDYMLGGKRFSDFSKHPNVLNQSPYGSSTAAGQYQFLKSTWDEQAAKYGYKDFKPETQDMAAWNYARDVYKQKTGRVLEDDLATKDPAILNEISKVLGPTWTSLPGGPQPNSSWKGKNFADVYSENLAGGGGPDPTPNVGSGESGYRTETAMASTTSPGEDVTTATEKKKSKGYGEIAGEALGDIGKLYAEGPVAKNAARAPGPTTVAAPVLPTPQAPVPMMDPRRAEAQRQQLALAMQRLNAGRLV